MLLCFFCEKKILLHPKKVTNGITGWDVFLFQSYYLDQESPLLHVIQADKEPQEAIKNHHVILQKPAVMGRTLDVSRRCRLQVYTTWLEQNDWFVTLSYMLYW